MYRHSPGYCIEANVIEASFSSEVDYTIEVTVIEDFGNTNLEFALNDGPFQSSLLSLM